MTSVATTALLARFGAAPFLTDGGLETGLIFHDGMDLPQFASYPCCGTVPGGRRWSDIFAGFWPRPMPRAGGLC